MISLMQARAPHLIQAQLLGAAGSPTALRRGLAVGPVRLVHPDGHLEPVHHL